MLPCLLRPPTTFLRSVCACVRAHPPPRVFSPLTSTPLHACRPACSFPVAHLLMRLEQAAAGSWPSATGVELGSARVQAAMVRCCCCCAELMLCPALLAAPALHAAPPATRPA